VCDEEERDEKETNRILMANDDPLFFYIPAILFLPAQLTFTDTQGKKKERETRRDYIAGGTDGRRRRRRKSFKKIKKKKKRRTCVTLAAAVKIIKASPNTHTCSL
jgi:hypothetical protein